MPETQFDASVDDNESVDVEADERGIAINARKTRQAPGVDKVEREQKLIKLISHTGGDIDLDAAAGARSRWRATEQFLVCGERGLTVHVSDTNVRGK